MDQTEITYAEIVPIDGYGPGFFRVNDQVINGAALVLPARTIPWGGYGDTDSILTAVDDIDVVFIGTGAEITHLPVDFKETLEVAGIGVEPMSSPSACKLYNILVAEGRRVACALLPV